MKRLILFTLFVVWLCPVLANAVPIDADLSGNRSIGNGIDATDGTKETDGWKSKGFNVSWTITLVNGLYNYSYTFTPSGQGEVSHLILEVSPFITADNWNNYLFNFSGGTVYAPQEWTTSGGQNLPDSIYGIKLDFGGSPVTYTFTSTQRPVWGDFWAKDGAFGEAWNIGIGSDPDQQTTSFLNWIATPDTLTAPVPEPATLMLFGTGLLALAFARRRQK